MLGHAITVLSTIFLLFTGEIFCDGEVQKIIGKGKRSYWEFIESDVICTVNDVMFYFMSAYQCTIDLSNKALKNRPPKNATISYNKLKK